MYALLKYAYVRPVLPLGCSLCKNVTFMFNMLLLPFYDSPVIVAVAVRIKSYVVGGLSIDNGMDTFPS